ncbi:hypothetical protein TASIC1_0005044400 [Trichoderma asperellum]|uniref:Uncharacterized protein n=1 Tax=Trichoderma asperellum TaxID=101201 RepID=A0A6V8QUW3_TRIAP|nr:hypothetical protein LI328DRAFT_149187 [Trichoderma asperelloides]GFP55586.1 hypothetical protein TASIC1_0005044400 [Trichoderma asperellum]
MTDITKPTKHNNAFYAAIAGSLVGLFMILFVPCIIAMFVVRCREKRQERRDALAEAGDDDDDECDTDYLIYGPFPFDSALYHVDELGESSGYREPQDGAQELDSATQLNANQQEDAPITATQQELYNSLDDLREPQYEGKGKAPVYSQLQTVLAEREPQQLPENAPAKLPGHFQEHLPDATVQLQAEQKAAEESQDAPDVVSAEGQEQLAKKEDQA